MFGGFTSFVVLQIVLRLAPQTAADKKSEIVNLNN
jgi:hypothetical protein